MRRPPNASTKFLALTPADWEQAARNRGLTVRERAFAHNLARSAPT